MKNKDKNKNDKIYRKYSLEQAGMLVQFILCVCLLIFAILTIFYPGFMLACELTAGITLLVIGYNNHCIYKRKSFTLVYTIMGVVTLIFAFIDMLS